MREKQRRVLLTFHTTADAIAMERFCKREGLPGRLIPVPRCITADCGMAWSAPYDARGQLTNAPGVPNYAGVYDMML